MNRRLMAVFASALFLVLSLIPPPAHAAQVTATTAGTKPVGALTYVWGSTGAPSRPVWTEVKVSAEWRRSQSGVTTSSGGYTLPLTYGATTPGVYTFRVGVSTTAGNVYSSSFTLTRTSTAPLKYSATQVQQWIRGIGSPSRKLVFLTFDDGPNSVTTPTILTALTAAKVKATFFVVGNTLDRNPSLLRREHQSGHAVALHSWTHDYGLLYPGGVASPSRVAYELDRTLTKTRQILGSGFSTRAWRYPGGHMSWRGMPAADARLSARGFGWVDWTDDTRDSAPASSRPTTISQLVYNATASIRRGRRVAVVLAHDTANKLLTARSVPALIQAYKNAGYTFAVIG